MTFIFELQLHDLQVEPATVSQTISYKISILRRCFVVNIRARAQSLPLRRIARKYVMRSRRKKRKCRRVQLRTKGETIMRSHNADKEKSCTHELHIFVISSKREVERLHSLFAGTSNRATWHPIDISMLFIAF